MPDRLYDYLNKLSIPDAAKADLWDLYQSAKTPDELAARLKPFKIGDTVKADIWDLKAGQSPAVQPPAADDETDDGLLSSLYAAGVDFSKGIGKSILGTIESGGNLIRKIPGVAALENATGAYIDTGINTAPANTAQSVGRVVGDVAQAIIPGRAITGMATKAAGAMPKVLGAAGRLAARAGVEGAGAGAVAALQGQDVSTGAALGAAVPIAGAAVRGARSLLPTGRVAPPVADAIAFAGREGIPVDAATASGSPFTKVVQDRIENSLGGAGTAEKFRAAQTSALASTGERLGARTGVAPVTAEQAGHRTVEGVKGVIRQQHDEATRGYDALRQLELDPANQTPIVTGYTEKASKVLDASGQPKITREPVTELMAFPVDLKASKTALRPMYTKLLRERELTGTVPGVKGRALQALDSLMTAPDHAPLSVVDAALSEIKAMARGADMPELRSSGQGIAAEAVRTLQGAVMKAAGNAPPAVMKALDAGRTATTAKYVTADILDALTSGTNDESVRVFNRLTGRQDTAIGLLRDVAKTAPEAPKEVGRAYLDDLIGKATAEGGFSGGPGLLKQWQTLGAETKALLFPDAGLRKDLDHFFLLAKKMGEVSNPSGTAKAMNALNVATVPITYLGAQLFYSDRGRKALLQGMSTGKVEPMMQTLSRIMASQQGRLAPEDEE